MRGNLKIIYNASNLTEAHIVAGLLNANGIETHVGGHYLQGGIGELAAADFATVFVADENIVQATALIAEYEGSNKPVTSQTENKRNVYITPIMVIALSLLLILFLTYIFSEQ
jgi:hypothetical protein